MRDLKIAPRPTNRNEDSLYRYLNDLGDTKPLKVEEEVMLAKKIKEGDEQALNKLIRANLKFVVSIAKGYMRPGIGLGDLINEGNIGLIRAAKTFDETKGFKFISYAVWYIRAAILAALGEHIRTIRLPMSQIKTIMDAKGKQEILAQKLEREPTIEEVAELLSMPADNLKAGFLADRSIMSLDNPLCTDVDTSLGNITPDENIPKPDQDLNKIMMKAEVRRLLQCLPAKQRMIVKQVYGLDQEYAVDFEQLGPNFGKTPTWARQINRKAICTLKTFAKPDLVEYLQ